MLVQRISLLSSLGSDPAAAQWRDAVVANGGTVSATQLGRVATLIRSMRASGSWAALDDAWLLVSESSIQALTSLKQRRLATPVNSPAFTAGAGYAFDGATNYIDTGFIPNTHKVNLAQDNARSSVYVRNNIVSLGYALAANSSGGRTIRLRPRTTGTTSSGEANCIGGTFTLPAADSRGLYAASRSTADATTDFAYKNGASLTRTVDPSTFPTTGVAVVSIYLGAQNNAGTAASFSLYVLGWASVGAPLSAGQELAEYNAVQAYMTSWGANV